jgi:hypothetical protein
MMTQQGMSRTLWISLDGSFPGLCNKCNFWEAAIKPEFEVNNSFGKGDYHDTFNANDN